jgi:hypothetical protein
MRALCRAYCTSFDRSRPHARRGAATAEVAGDNIAIARHPLRKARELTLQYGPSSLKLTLP